MHPLLTVVQLGPHAVPIGSYGVLLAIAIAVAAAASLHAARELALDLGAAVATIGVVTASAFVGGFALHTLVQWARLDSVHASLHGSLSQPGMTIIGAVPAAAVGLALAARALGQPALRWTERALPGLLLALAIGRVGCLLGGCCYGVPSHLPWAVRYTHPLAPAAVLDVARHPVPLYEALWALGLAAALVVVRRGTAAQRVGASALAYALARSLFELARGDVVRGLWLFGLSTAQLASVVALFAWLGWAATRGPGPCRDGV